MPLTFPSHAALPLPLKLWRPRWFDGVALVVGAAAPDLAYPLDGTGLALYQLAHAPLGLILFCLPVTLVCCVLVRWAAPVVAVHLPEWPASLALRDYGVLGVARPALVVSAVSAVLGAGSHQLWDWATAPAPLFDVGSTVGGAVGFAGLMVYIGRRRLLRAWHGAAPSPAASPALFWSVVAMVVVLGGLVASGLPGAFLPHTTVTRMIGVVALGLLTATVLVRRRAV